MAQVQFHDLDNDTKERAAHVVATYTITSADDTAGTVALTLSDLKTIQGVLEQVRAANGDIQDNDIKVTWSGNVLTLADGTTDAITSGETVIIHAFSIVSE